MLFVLILCISGGTYSLKSTPNDRFFQKLFMAILLTLTVFVLDSFLKIDAAVNVLRNKCREIMWNRVYQQVLKTLNAYILHYL